MSVHPVSNLSICSVHAAVIDTLRRDRYRRGRFGLGRVAIALTVSGCSRAPTMDLLGSYFPGWMLCAAVGVLAAIIIWRILAMAGIDEHVVAPLLTYGGLALSATLLAWLLWFGH
jgi:YtcA family